MRRILIVVASVVALSSAFPAQSMAVPVVGLSDQIPASFEHPLFDDPGFSTARYITPWNSIFTQPEALDLWIRAAQAERVRILIAFNHASGERCPASPCRLPSVRQYARAFQAFRARYPEITDISPWNEVNHQSQPTARNPRRAAEYFNYVSRNCRGCRVVAADLLDSPNMRNYFRDFNRFARRPRIWGLHNYTDTNRNRTTSTRLLLRLVPRRGGHEIWFTETGGVVSFVTTGGRVALPYDESRAERSINHMFRLAALDSRRIKRIYIYHWRAAPAGQNRFDAGLIRADGTARPSFNALLQNLGRPLISGVSPQPAPPGSLGRAR